MNTKKRFAGFLLTGLLLWAVAPGYSQNVTFLVDMSEQTVSPDGVHLAGTFTGWSTDSLEMAPVGDSIYSITVTLPSDSLYEYKFINGNSWGTDEMVPAECGVPNGSGGYNRQIDVPAYDTTLTAVCFGSCNPCPEPPQNFNITFLVDMSEQTVSPDGVHITGTFANWITDSLEMSPAGDNIFTITLPLLSGTQQQYKFINGIAWGTDETVPAECGVPNGSGGYNRYFIVPFQDMTIPLVCFSRCDSCLNLPAANVTFRVDMAGQTISPLGVHIAGTFNNWNPGATLMTQTAITTVYEATFTITVGDTAQYKYINGNDWGMDEIVPAACGIDDGTGIYNRFVKAPPADTILPRICFGLCTGECGVGIPELSSGEIILSQNSPNPFRENTRITFTLPEKATVNLVILDMMGQTVLHPVNRKYDAGNHLIELPASNLAPGIYQYRLTVETTHGNTTLSRQMIVLK